MKNRRTILAGVKKVLTLYFPLVLLLALPVVAVVSWIFSIYFDMDVKSLLNSDGIRWAVSNGVNNLGDAPIVGVMLTMVCLGVLWESGLVGTASTVVREMKWSESGVSLKQRRALMLSIGVFELIIVVFLIMFLMPGALLLSAFGTFEASALSDGWVGLVALLIIIVSNVFGYSSGKLVKLSDFINAHTCVISR